MRCCPATSRPARPSCATTIKATVGFEKLGEATDTPPKSLIRMFGPRGNPQAKNLFSVIGTLQKRAGVQLHVSAVSQGVRRNSERGERIAPLVESAEHASLCSAIPSLGYRLCRLQPKRTADIGGSSK